MKKNCEISTFVDSFPDRKIIVIQGLGFVGSVMSLVCANSKNNEYAVIGVDLPTKHGKRVVDSINNGVFPLTVTDPKIKDLFDKARLQNNFLATTQLKAYKYANIIIVDINLDVIKNNNALGMIEDYKVDLRSFKESIKTIGDNCNEDCLILIESTVPPGTCKEVVKPIINNCFKRRNLSIENIKIGHSYERVMPGPGYIDSIQNFYRVYSGIDEKSADEIEEFLHTVINTKDYPLTRLDNTNASEMAKVLENSYRAMNIAFMVEWTRFAEETEVNIYDVINAIRIRPTHSNLMYPGIGVGGYCLTKDALLASWSRQNLFGKNKPLLQSEKAIDINDQMPRFAFEFLKDQFPNLANSSVLLLGVSYRGDIGDTRSSPVEKLYNYLIKEDCTVSCHDPYVDYWNEKSIKITKELPELINNTLDLIIISTGHSIYRENNTIDMIMKLKPVFLYDTLGYLSNNQIKKIQRKHSVKVLGRGDL